MVIAKKSLGQNFLVSKRALADIIGASEIQRGETVLEIGPGKGALTAELLRSGAKVIAIEKDRELIPFLQEKFSVEVSSKQLILINADILDFDPKRYTLNAIPYKLIANIPYYITGQIFRKFLQSDSQPSRMVLLVQKEVADRIVALDGKESLLSISVKVYGTPKRVAVVKAGSFVPAPKVDSAIILISNISKKFFSEIDEEKFFEILRVGFAHKRKILSGNLKLLMSRTVLDIRSFEKVFEGAGISKNVRAENLTLGQWQEVAFNLKLF